MNVLFSDRAPGISVAATAVALSAVALPLSDGNSIRIVNEGPNIVFVALGASDVAATLPTTGVGTRTCTAVLSGTDITLRRDPLVDKYISTICRAAGTGTLSVYVGEGQ